MTRRSALSCCAALLVFAGCSDEVPPAVVEVSFAADVQPIFATHCLSCHPPSGGLDLSASVAHGNVVGVTSFGYAPAVLVQPGFPEESVLYGKVTGTFATGVMALPDLDAAEVEIIFVWIQEGAMDN